MGLISDAPESSDFIFSRDILQAQANGYTEVALGTPHSYFPVTSIQVITLKFCRTHGFGGKVFRERIGPSL